MNAVDLRGVTPLHLAQSRLRLIGDSEGRGSAEGIPLTRKKEITNVWSPYQKFRENEGLLQIEYSMNTA